MHRLHPASKKEVCVLSVVLWMCVSACGWTVWMCGSLRWSTCAWETSSRSAGCQGAGVLATGHGTQQTLRLLNQSPLVLLLTFSPSVLGLGLLTFSFVPQFPRAPVFYLPKIQLDQDVEGITACTFGERNLNMLWSVLCLSCDGLELSPPVGLLWSVQQGARSQCCRLTQSDWK